MKQKILFVDDEQRVLDGLQRMLREHAANWEMVFLANPLKAREILEGNNFHVAVLDIMMPEKNGIELLREIKTNPETRDTEVIMLTGLQENQLKREALDLGATDLLNKPINREDLVARIKSALRIKAYCDELSEKNLLLEKQLIQSQKMEVIGLLTAGVAHDLNNILHAIIGYSSLISLSVADDPATRELREMLAHIDAASARASRIVQQILLFSRQRTPVAEPVDMESVISECMEMLRVSAPKTIQFEFIDDFGKRFVEADSTQLFQAIMNLALNGVQAMAEEGLLRIRLGISERGPARGAPDCYKFSGPFVQVDISDTGKGMDDIRLSQIFTPLFTTKGATGTGLGLPVAERIITGFHGFIVAESQPGEGSTFSIYLPLVSGKKG